MGSASSSAKAAKSHAVVKKDVVQTEAPTDKKVKCSCEGGRNCKHESPSEQAQGTGAIAGLHSNWVADDVLAMARPWQKNLQELRIVEAFQHHNIGMLVNLQEVGEHSDCGPGILPHSGFTYDPETFMAAGIGYYNFAWPEKSVRSLDRMLDIVQVMQHVRQTEGKRIAVHGHAGLGRTGMVIACYLVFARGILPADAVAQVRRDRPKSVAGAGQESFVHIFAKYLAHLRCVLPVVALPVIDAVVAAASERTQPATAGPLTVKEQGISIVETYANGLIVVKPASSPTKEKVASTPETPAQSSVEQMVAKEHLPWTQNFEVPTSKASESSFVPRSPVTYADSLFRQNRLLHGSTRRVMKHLHRLVREICIAAIDIARCHPSSTFLSAPGHGQPGQGPPSPSSMQEFMALDPFSHRSAPSPALQSSTISIAPHSSPSHQGSLYSASPTASTAYDRTSPAHAAPSLPQQQLQHTPHSPYAEAEGHFPAYPNASTFHDRSSPVYPNASLSQQHQQQQPLLTPPRTTPNTQPGANVSGYPNAPPTHSTEQHSSLGTPAAEPPPSTLLPARAFPDAFLECLRSTFTDDASSLLPKIALLAMEPGGACIVGLPPAPLPSRVTLLSQHLNAGDFACLRHEPLLVLMGTLHAFFAAFGSPALSDSGIQHMQAMVSRLQPAAAAGDVPDVIQVQQASPLIRELWTTDQELLLIMAALLRHTFRAQGPHASEETVAEICLLCARLLTGPHVQQPEAGHAACVAAWLRALSFHDAFYVAGVLAKKDRMEAARSAIPGSNSVYAPPMAPPTNAPPFPKLFPPNSVSDELSFNGAMDSLVNVMNQYPKSARPNMARLAFKSILEKTPSVVIPQLPQPIDIHDAWI